LSVLYANMHVRSHTHIHTSTHNQWRLEWQRVLAGEATYVYNSHDSLFDRFFAGEEDLPDRHSQLHGVKKRPNSTANLDVWWLAFARDNLSHRAGDKEVYMCI
jgi:hypothetical protein